MLSTRQASCCSDSNPAADRTRLAYSIRLCATGADPLLFLHRSSVAHSLTTEGHPEAMSAVEAVAGLVLGGFPLLISTVENYREVFEALGCWTEFRAEYRKCRNRLCELELSYDLILDKLFYPVVDSEEELSDLKRHPQENGWADVEARLQKRLLPRVSTVYHNTMKDLKEVIEELMEELGSEKPLFQYRVSQVGSGYKLPSKTRDA